MSERDDSIGRMIDGASDGSSDYLAVCEALGIVYAADGVPLGAGPIDAVLVEIKRLQGAYARTRDLLIAQGCECECGCDSDGHADDCERCFPCEVEAALREEPGE